MPTFFWYSDPLNAVGSFLFILTQAISIIILGHLIYAQTNIVDVIL